MKMNIGRVSSGYHFISFIAAENGMSDPPVPQSISAATAATPPIAAEDAHASQQHQHHQREHEERDHLVGHQISSPRRCAMSLKNSEKACNSISAMPVHITSLIGHITGRQAVGLRSPYSSE